MSSPIASEMSPSATEAWDRPRPRPHFWPRPVAAPFKRLTALGANECRYCVQDTPEGDMHHALFCAQPAPGGAYCSGHARVCRRPNDLDIEQLAAELAAATRA